MDKWFGEKFTDMVMDKWGELFELDRDKVLKSFDRLKGLNERCSREIFEAMAYCAPAFVPSLLLSDYFLGDVTNTVKDDKPYEPDKWDHVYSFNYKVSHMIDIDLNDPDFVWNIYADATLKGNEDLNRFFSGLEILIKDINGVQFEFVQYILNNIGVVIYHFWYSTPFRMYVMNNLEKFSRRLGDFCWEWRKKHDPEGLQKYLDEWDEACGL